LLVSPLSSEPERQTGRFCDLLATQDLARFNWLYYDRRHVHFRAFHLAIELCRRISGIPRMTPELA
jgi:hypothetical protein